MVFANAYNYIIRGVIYMEILKCVKRDKKSIHEARKERRKGVRNRCCGNWVGKSLVHPP